MQLPPIEVIITWPQGDYTNPSEVRGPAIVILTLIMVPLLVILVALRTYSRLRISKNFGSDDMAIVAAVIPTIGVAVITTLAVKSYGWSRHVWDIPADQLSFGLRLVIAVEVLFSVGCTLTKLSMLLLICRIMRDLPGVLKRIAQGVMVLVCVESFIFCIVVINTCRPVSDYWTLSLAPQECINEAAHLLSGGIINTFTDFCVVLLPIPVVLKLKLPWRQRFICVLLFGAGFVVCIAGGIRIAYTYELNISYDKTWLSYPVWISGTIELYLGIIATSIPAIKPLISRYFPKILGSSFRKGGIYGTYGQGYGQDSSNGNGPVKSEPKNIEAMDESSLKSPRSEPDDIDLVKMSATPKVITTERRAIRMKTKSLSLTPVISQFSTYTKIIKAAPHPIATERR